MRVNGVVKRYYSEKGFGFIKLVGGGDDVFVHAKAARESGVQSELKEGDKLTFEVEQGDRGPRAVRLERA